jgi:hypothetical protein
MVVMWKGSLVDHMITIDDNGDPTGLFREELIENDTWGSYSWTPEVAAFVESIAGAGLETGAGAGTGAGLETRAAEDAQPADGATSAVTPHPPREDPPAGSAASAPPAPLPSTMPAPPPPSPPWAPSSPKPSPPVPPSRTKAGPPPTWEGKAPPAPPTPPWHLGNNGKASAAATPKQPPPVFPLADPPVLPLAPPPPPPAAPGSQDPRLAHSLVSALSLAPLAGSAGTFGTSAVAGPLQTRDPVDRFDIATPPTGPSPAGSAATQPSTAAPSGFQSEAESSVYCPCVVHDSSRDKLPAAPQTWFPVVPSSAANKKGTAQQHHTVEPKATPPSAADATSPVPASAAGATPPESSNGVLKCDEDYLGVLKCDEEGLGVLKCDSDLGVFKCDEEHLGVFMQPMY